MGITSIILLVTSPASGRGNLAADIIVDAAALAAVSSVQVAADSFVYDDTPVVDTTFDVSMPSNYVQTAPAVSVQPATPPVYTTTSSYQPAFYQPPQTAAVATPAPTPDSTQAPAACCVIL